MKKQVAFEIDRRFPLSGGRDKITVPSYDPRSPHQPDLQTAALQLQNFLKVLAFMCKHVASGSQIKLPFRATTACTSSLSPFCPSPSLFRFHHLHTSSGSSFLCAGKKSGIQMNGTDLFECHVPTPNKKYVPKELNTCRQGRQASNKSSIANLLLQCTWAKWKNYNQEVYSK